MTAYLHDYSPRRNEVKRAASLCTISILNNEILRRPLALNKVNWNEGPLLRHAVWLKHVGSLSPRSPTTIRLTDLETSIEYLPSSSSLQSRLRGARLIARMATLRHIWPTILLQVSDMCLTPPLYPIAGGYPQRRSPVERLADEAARLHGLHEHEHLKVRHVLDLIVPRLEEILLRHEHSLLEEVRVDRQAVLLLDELSRSKKHTGTKIWITRSVRQNNSSTAIFSCGISIRFDCIQKASQVTTWFLTREKLHKIINSTQITSFGYRGCGRRER